MKESILIEVSKDELQEMINQAILQATQERNKEIDVQNFSIKALSIKTKRSYGFIKSRITKGILKTTADGKFITGQSVREYFPEGTI